MKTGSYWIIAIFACLASSFLVWACATNPKSEEDPDIVADVQPGYVGNVPIYRFRDRNGDMLSTCYLSRHTEIYCTQQYVTPKPDPQVVKQSKAEADADAERRREDARRRAERARDRLRRLRAEAARKR